MDSKKLEALNKTKSLRITELENQIEELNKQIEYLQKENNKIKIANNRMREYNLRLKGGIDELKCVIKMMMGNLQTIIKIPEDDEY